MHTRQLLETEITRVMQTADFKSIAKLHNQLLEILGNAEGDEIVALTVLAVRLHDQEKHA